MSYSPKTIAAPLASCLVALCLTACGGGGHMTPGVTTEEAPRPLIPIDTKILFRHFEPGVGFGAYVMDGDGDARAQLASSQQTFIEIQDVSGDGQTVLFLLSGRLSTMGVDGSNSRVVLTGPGEVLGARFSPNGTQILYWSEESDVQHVYVMDIYVGRPRPFRVTHAFSGGASHPQYNHDGSRIVFVTHTAGAARIWTIDPDGTNPDLVTATGPSFYTRPRFNHDGTMICYIHPIFLDGSGYVYVINADGTGSTQVTFGSERADAPVFSADGTRVFFNSGRTGDLEIYSVSLTGTDVRNVTNRPDTDDYGFVVTASGQQILFTSGTPDRRMVVAMNSDGSGQTVLSRGSGHDTYPVVPGGIR